MQPPLSIGGPFATFAERLLRIELPDLPDSARAETVAFVCQRAGQIAGPLRLGVRGLALLTGGCQRLVGVDRTTELLRTTQLPLAAELPRLVRSLAFAFVWETWPDTTPLGGQPWAA